MPPLTAYQARQITQLHDRGLSYRKIAELTGRSTSTVYGRIKGKVTAVTEVQQCSAGHTFKGKLCRQCWYWKQSALARAKA